MSEYLAFTEIRDTGKTKVISVDAKSSGDLLGIIKWYGPWRQYVLHPEPYTLWNKGCLSDVNDHMDELMRARKSPTP